jgi:hypothetical protein
MQMNEPSPIAVKRLLFWIIWGALNVSMLLYILLVTRVLNRAGQEQPVRDMGNLQLIFMVISVAMALGSVAIYQMALARRRRDEQTSDPVTALNRAFPLYIICWVMNESICIFGFVLAMLTFESGRIYPFFGVALLLNLAMYPRFSR